MVATITATNALTRSMRYSMPIGAVQPPSEYVMTPESMTCMRSAIDAPNAHQHAAVATAHAAPERPTSAATGARSNGTTTRRAGRF